LQGIANKEHIKTEETALQLIAQKSEGCMRDALSILDKIVSFTNGEVTYENTIGHLNILDADYYFRLIDSMLNQDLAGAMLLYDDIDKKGFEGDMVLNGFAEFIRNLLICKDERVAGLLEVVESFKQRYTETAKRTEPGYLVSALNILNEAEINYRSARNKRLHVELVLIKLCYLKQALEITSNGTVIDKKKIVESSKAIAFKTIQPIVASPVKSEIKKSTPAVTEPSSAKLIIETKPEQKIVEPVQKKVTDSVQEPPTNYKSNGSANGKPKLGALEALRQKIKEENCNDGDVIDHPLEMEGLKKAWSLFIGQLKENKNPAWTSFEIAELKIRDANSFEAIVNNNIHQKFLEFERNKVSAFLQKELCNRQLQFVITLVEGQQHNFVKDLPLSSREQYQKIIEQYPLVKELKDKLRLELDY
jgi:DNA polymerase III subunit gamma/tau